MTSDADYPLYQLPREQFERETMPQIERLSKKYKLKCSFGLASRTQSQDGQWSIELQSLADHIYWSWSKNYKLRNDAKGKRLAPSQRKKKIQDTAAKLENFIRALNDSEELLKCFGNTIFEREGEWSDEYLFDLKHLLRDAAANIREMSEQEFTPKKRGPTNPGLYYLIGELDMFWRTYSLDRKNLAAHFEESWDENDPRDNPPMFQKPLNDGSRFCCDVARMIDPSIKNSQVLNVMKSIEIPDHIRKFVIKTARIAGRDTC